MMLKIRAFPRGCGGSLPRPSRQVLAFLSLLTAIIPALAESRFHFVDVARESGLSTVLLAGRPDKDHLLDSAGTGVAWIDFDRDGWMDIYLVNGWELSGSSVVQKGRNALYRNQRDGTFKDVTEYAGVGGEGHWGSGVAVADYDQDGWPDILVTNFGPTLLYRNLGNGRFTNVAKESGIESPGWNTGAVLFDADGDGDLDLYVSAYIDCSLEDVLVAKPTLDWKGVAKVAVGPFGLEGAPDHFFVSDGRGRYVDRTVEAGFSDQSLGFGFSVRAADFDDDGDIDLYVANDSDPNYYFRNDGAGTFQEIGLWNGSALSANGAAQAGMGVAVGDVDQDLILDILVNNFSEDFSALYRGLSDGFFEDVSLDSGIGEITYKSLSWGALLSDLDCDGDLDIVIGNGHIYPQVDRYPEIGQSYKQRNHLIENLGNDRFREATADAGPGFSLVQSTRGLAAGDYDNDGDLDLLMSNLDEPPTLLRNDSEKGSWLAVVPEVAPGRGPVIGTTVVVTAAGKSMRRDIASSDSFVSVNDPRLYFGLGRADSVDRIEVRWPDGSKTIREGIRSNQFVRVEKP